MTLVFCVDVKSEPSASSDWVPMLRVALASREVPFPTKYIEQAPNVDLLLDLKVFTTPVPAYVALTCATLVVPVGRQPVAPQVNASSVMSIGASVAPARLLVSIQNALWASGAQPVS
jgi:hypothetical protein